MSKAVMLSIQPKWCELIASGKKTIEVRKTRPKLETPFKCYIYCTLKGSNEFFRDTLDGDISRWNKGKWGNKKGKVIGEFNCYGIIEYDYNSDGYGIREEDRLCYLSCLTPKELYHYLQGDKCYGWCFDNLVIYDEPKEFYNFCRPCDKNCDKCNYLDVQEIGNSEHTIIFKTCLNRITIPPQSWFYVEELNE